MKEMKGRNMKQFGLALLLLTIVAQVQGKESPITLSTESGEIHGTLCTPDAGARDVAVLLVCGSWPTDRDGNNRMMKNNSIKYLAEDLAAAGIASIRYDKRGIAASTSAGPKEEDLRFTTYVDDAKG